MSYGIEVKLDYDLPNNIKFIGYLDVVIKKDMLECNKDI